MSTINAYGAFEKAEAWLPRSRVTYTVKPVKGQWEVWLLLVDPLCEASFLAHHLGLHRSERRAHLCGEMASQSARRYAYTPQ